MSHHEHLVTAAKISVVFGIAATTSLLEGISWEFIITKVLPVALAMGFTYLMLFADTRYVRKQFYYAQRDRVENLHTDIEVIKAQLNRIEKNLDKLSK